MFLTAESEGTDEHNRPITVGTPCDLEGNPAAKGFEVETYLDLFTGKRYAKLCTDLPSLKDRESKELRASYEKLNPLHFSEGAIRGYFVPAPDFTKKPSPGPQSTQGDGTAQRTGAGPSSGLL
jgi:hypothetical protein